VQFFIELKLRFEYSGDEDPVFASKEGTPLGHRNLTRRGFEPLELPPTGPESRSSGGRAWLLTEPRLDSTPIPSLFFIACMRLLARAICLSAHTSAKARCSGVMSSRRTMSRSASLGAA
jgi:hypothetical protein